MLPVAVSEVLPVPSRLTGVTEIAVGGALRLISALIRTDATTRDLAHVCGEYLLIFGKLKVCQSIACSSILSPCSFPSFQSFIARIPAGYRVGFNSFLQLLRSDRGLELQVMGLGQARSA